MEIAAAGEDKKALRAVAAALLEKAMAGDLPAIKELADRTDGKVAQQINHADEMGDGPARILFQTIYERPDND